MPATVDRIQRLSADARRAARARQWPILRSAAEQILKLDRNSAEGWFLLGLAEKAAGRIEAAGEAFVKVLNADPARYDAAIELAWLYWSTLHHQQAKSLLEKYEPRLSNSPHYLVMAADTWSRLGLHARAWPLYRQANELQPGADGIQAKLGACAVLIGEIEQATSIYLELLARNPLHQRNHYELSKLARARDMAHVEQMKQVLDETRLPPEKNIFLYYAIAKELEDLGHWDEAFRYYRLGGDAAARGARSAGYTVDSDVKLIERIIGVCDETWLKSQPARASEVPGTPTPIFVVGLPRTGTTLTERIIGSHSRVESADETFFLPIAIRQASGARGNTDLTATMIETAARQDMGVIGRRYLESAAYRLTDKPFFIDKYPLNFLYLGFISRAFPDARIVHLRRSPMDACFAMYKQSFFRFAYTLDDLAEYYIAYDRLSRHWREHMTDRIIEVEYEKLVADPDAQIRQLLDHLGLDFEQSCVDFHLNAAPSATASTVQVRERAHTRSVARWRKFEKHLQPLRARLEAAGIATG